MKGSGHPRVSSLSEESLSAVRLSFLETSTIYQGLTRIATGIHTDAIAPALYPWNHKRSLSTTGNCSWRDL
jgi:hypothetical protein